MADDGRKKGKLSLKRRPVGSAAQAPPSPTANNAVPRHAPAAAATAVAVSLDDEVADEQHAALALLTQDYAGLQYEPLRLFPRVLPPPPPPSRGTRAAWVPLGGERASH